MSDDLRRRQYVPLATHFATARTGTRIQETYGIEGIGVWAMFLAAAKKSQLQGTVIWASEAEAWSLLGVIEPPSSFTFAEFVGLLGRLKQARTRRVGRESHTTLTRFSEWNKTPRSQSEAARKRRKREENIADGSADDRADIGPPEGEGEGEPPNPPRKRRTRTPDQHPLAITDDRNRCPHCGTRQRTAGELADHLKYIHAITEPDSPDGATLDYLEELARTQTAEDDA